MALLAGVCALLLPHIPIVHYLCYPLELLVTAVHEMSHALAAIVSGGRVVSIVVNGDTSGVTQTIGGNGFLISSAGYVGSTLFGCLLLVAAQKVRWHRGILIGLFVWFLAFLLLARNLLAMGIGLAALAVVWAAGRGETRVDVRYFVLDFLAISSCLYAAHDFVTLVLMSAGMVAVGGPIGMTDAHILAATTGVPPLAWALGWAVFSASAAWVSIRLALRLTSRSR